MLLGMIFWILVWILLSGCAWGGGSFPIHVETNVTVCPTPTEEAE